MTKIPATIVRPDGKRVQNPEYFRQYHQSNKKRKSYLNSLKRQEWKKELMEMIGGARCKDCGHDDIRVLQFDHLDDKTCNVSRLLTRSWSKAITEVQKCEVVCANCHVLRTLERRPTLENVETTWINLSKDTCPKGHPKTENNLYRYNGKAFCRMCRSEDAKRRRMVSV